MTHKKFEKLMLEAFYNELPAEEKTRFQGHLDSCPQCGEKYARLTTMLQTIRERHHPEPDEAYWNSYWSRLEPALRSEIESKKQRIRGNRWIETFQDFLGPRRRLVYALGVATLCVAAGIVIGRFMIQPGVPLQQLTTIDRPGLPPDNVATVNRTAAYLDRSRTLLLGIINSDTTGAGGVDLPKQKTVSRELVNEARVLQAGLKGRDQAQLRRLVSELEVIMLQIANLEVRTDDPAIQIIRNGVDRSAILLKINLEQMQMETHVTKDGKPNS